MKNEINTDKVSIKYDLSHWLSCILTIYLEWRSVGVTKFVTAVLNDFPSSSVTVTIRFPIWIPTLGDITFSTFVLLISSKKKNNLIAKVLWLALRRLNLQHLFNDVSFRPFKNHCINISWRDIYYKTYEKKIFSPKKFDLKIPNKFVR